MLSGSQREPEAPAVTPTQTNYVVPHPPGTAGVVAACGFMETIAPAMDGDT
jgi:hypothetical protein